MSQAEKTSKFKETHQGKKRDTDMTGESVDQGMLFER